MRIRSYIYPQTVQDVKMEYEAASKAEKAWERAKWNSHESMHGRFEFALQILPFERIDHWLDIGCGEGDFFRIAERSRMKLKEQHGVDATPSMIRHAIKKKYKNPTSFQIGDFSKLALPPDYFDLVTMLGVLHRCGVPLKQALIRASATLHEGGLIFLTTKNIEWNEFRSGHLRPERTHSWYTFDDLVSALRSAMFRTIRYGGLIPSEVEECALNDSPTMYVLAEKMG